jgi:hypothetical protein
MKTSIKFTLMSLVALALAAMPLHAAEAKPKKEAGAAAASANRSIPFQGKLASKTDSSITVGARTFEVNSETKIVKAGKPATLADAVVGEAVGGAYWDRDGKMVLRSLRLGAKPEAPEKKPKKEKSAE